MLILLAVPVRAEMVIFTDGGWLHVAGFELEDDRVALDLPSGGRIVVSLLRIERIVEDEVADVPAAIEEPAGLDGFALHFEEDHPEPATPYGALIHAAAREHDLNPALVAAVVRAESAFRAAAESVKGACGLMQLMPATALRFGVEGDDVFDPEKNLDAGSRYLRWLAERYDGRLAWILAAYNAGEGTVDRYRGVPPYRETRRFVAAILDELGVAADADAGEKPVEPPPGPR